MRTWICVTAALSTVVCADLEVPSVISDHMVLQRDALAPIWGWADAGEMVTVRFGGAMQRVAADSEGRWVAELGPLEASAESRELTISTDDETITISDVLVGEVWLCSGQSNMVWNLRNTMDGERFIREATDTGIRMFTIPNTAEHTAQEDCAGQWRVASPETAGSFSAVAYHFGRELIDELEVPIGLVNSSWGGSTVEAWVSRPVLETISEAGPFLEAYDEHRLVDAAGVGEFIAAEVDPNGWETIQLPQLVEDAGHDVDGIMWFRRTVQVPASWVGEELVIKLGAIDDNDITFVNGTRVGATNNWQRPRSYRVPGSAVTSRRVTIAVRVEDTGGAGGFSGAPEQLMLERVVPGDAPVSLSGAWHWRHVSARASGPAQHKPANLYNGMIHPLRHMALRGVIWYQGESNAIRPRGEEYLPIFMAMIENWREVFGSAQLPFYYVQLPLFTNDEPNTVWRYPVVRQAQLETMRRVGRTGMAITLDLGEANDIHPRNKHDVGNRLARWALSDTYGVEGIVTSGPIMNGVVVQDDGAIVVRFDLYGSSLEASDSIGGFEVSDMRGEFHPASARVEGDTVVVTSDQKAHAIRYAWKNNPSDANLRNVEGLPASPFLVDLTKAHDGH